MDADFCGIFLVSSLYAVLSHQYDFYSVLSSLFSLLPIQLAVAVVFLLAAAAGLVLAVASGGRAAASAAAAAARHACCVCASFFFLIHNADASSTDIDPYTSGRSPQAVEITARHQVAV